jgi:hypothetical protein
MGACSLQGWISQRPHRPEQGKAEGASKASFMKSADSMAGMAMDFRTTPSFR